jgi:predicted dehydrogenase
MAVEALGAGKHVFIEKPMAMAAIDGERIHTAARAAGKMVMIGHSYQYHPAFLELKSIVHQGKLGKILHIQARRLAFGRIRHEEDAFWNLAPHDVSMILALVGQSPSLVQAKSEGHLRPHIADVVTADLTFASGVHAQILVSWLYPEKERKIIVVGDRGMAVFDDCAPWGKQAAGVPP